MDNLKLRMKAMAAECGILPVDRNIRELSVRIDDRKREYAKTHRFATHNNNTEEDKREALQRYEWDVTRMERLYRNALELKPERAHGAPPAYSEKPTEH